MKLLFASILMAAFFGGLPLHDFSVDRLTVHVNVAQAQIAPRRSDQHADYGESVTFALRADFRCRDDAAAESVVVSISDTLYRYVPAAGEKSILATVIVPARQIAPAETGAFCTIGEFKNGDLLLLPAAATAQVSLRCRVDDLSTISYASAALPLRLECQGKRDQTPSTSVGARAR